MKKNVTLLFICTVILISFWWVFNFISHNGEFTKFNHTTLSMENYKSGKAFYLGGYLFKWNGIGSPTLEKIEFIKRDGTIVAKENDEFSIQPYIASSFRIGSMDEKTVIEEGLKNDLVQVKGFKVNDDFYLVLRVKFKGSNPNNDIQTLRITYKKFGVTQFQNIPFDDGVIMENK